jgi:hypothetical protein
MSAPLALKAARDAGATVTVEGSNLVLRPASKIPSYVVDQLRRFKPEVVALLTARPVPVIYAHALDFLRARCPYRIESKRWRQAVGDGEAFLARWGAQAKSLGWTATDLFGLHQPPAEPHPSYSRLSRYDCTGLVWLLCGRPVIALTESTAAIENSTGNITIYRKYNKPALGPLGDSLDDF